MTRAHRKILYALTLLVVLVTSTIGHKVHIYVEDPQHFAAFSGDLVPDNGADAQIVERCVVDEYDFYPCLVATSELFDTPFTLLGIHADPPTRGCRATLGLGISLRAPPCRG